MTGLLADDPTAAALLADVPCYPVPLHGGSPALDALRAARVGRGLAVGSDGILLILRRPWLALDIPVTPPIAAHLPYGKVGGRKADLRCGFIPAGFLTEFVLVVIDGIPSGVFSVLDDAIPVDAARKSVADPAGFLIVIHWALACSSLESSLDSSLESSLKTSPASSWPPPGRRPGRRPGLLLPTFPGLLPGALLASLTSLLRPLLASSRPPPEDLGHQVSPEFSREPPEHFPRGRRKWRSHYKF